MATEQHEITIAVKQYQLSKLEIVDLGSKQYTLQNGIVLEKTVQ